MASQQRRTGPRLRSRIATPSLPYMIAASCPSSDADESDDVAGMTGPTGKSFRACFRVAQGSSASSSSSSTKAKRIPTATARARLVPQSKVSRPNPTPVPPRKSISSLLLVEMQEPSPPPYTSLEFDPNFDDSSYYRQRWPTTTSLQPIAGSSTTNLLHPATPPLPRSSSASCCTHPCSHSQCHLRRRNGTSSGSHQTSRFPSPTNSDSEVEDSAIYTSQSVRHRISEENGGPNLYEGEDSSTNNGTSKRPAVKNKWSWRHWLFALAAGVVGLGDGRDDDREEKLISTSPGGTCAGETETETDEPSRHLPTARIIPLSESSPLPSSALQHLRQKLIPLLFEFSRLLSIVPAFFGTICLLYWLIWPPTGIDTASESGGWGRRTPPERADFFVAALWSILTGYQCLALTTGLLTRWQTYYPPLATLIRLLALQGICWPATHVTLTVLDHVKRPVICWCVVGTTTCFSRSVQIWVTSNISVDLSAEEDPGGRQGTNPSSNLTGESISGHPANVQADTSTHLILNPLIHHPIMQRKPRFRWASTERRWDWIEVSLKCVLPAALLYFVMAWVGEFRREWAACC